MENENRAYKIYSVLNMGFAFLAVIIMLLSYYLSGKVSLSDEMDLSRLTLAFYGISGFLLLLGLGLRILFVKKTEKLPSEKALHCVPENQDSKTAVNGRGYFLLRRTIAIPAIQLVPAFLGLALILLGENFNATRYFYFIAIIGFTLCFIRFQRWQEVTGKIEIK